MIGERSGAAIGVLSAGASPYLREVLEAALRSVSRDDTVHLVWSGQGGPNGDLPAEVVRHQVAPGTFDHGRTRQQFLEECGQAYAVFLSDDAVPESQDWLQSLLTPFENPRVGAVYGRQRPRREAPFSEKVFRSVRYPEGAVTAQLMTGTHDALVMPISDANAAYRVRAVLDSGGFPRPCLYGEDQVLAMRLHEGGWIVEYQPRAVVWHSHDLTMSELFRRSLAAGKLAVPSEAGKVSPMIGTRRFALRVLREGYRQGGWLGGGQVLLTLLLRGSGLAIGRALRPSL